MAKTKSIKQKLAILDRGTEVVRLVRGGASIADVAEELDISLTVARAEWTAWFGFRTEENHELAKQVREDILLTLVADQAKWRKLALASVAALEALADAARDGEADHIQIAAFDVSTSSALMREYQSLTKLILGMVDASAEAADAHARRNLQGSGVTTFTELRERLADSPALAQQFVEAGVYAQLMLAAENMKPPIDV